MDGVGSLNTNLPNMAQIAGGVVARPVEQQAEAQAQRVAETPKKQETLSQRNPDESRLEAIKQAAKQQAVNYFVVSDSRFTIYKQQSGDNYVYVTRFTSLKDGSVTVIPEQELLSASTLSPQFQTNA